MTLDALLQHQAALLALAELGPEAMRATVDRALGEGIYQDDFIDAMYPGPYPPSDRPRKASVALLAARGFAVPDRHAAMWRVIASHMHRIADGRCDARRELTALIDVIDHRPELGEKVTTHLGDAFGIEWLIGHHWRFHELEESPDRVSCGGFYGVEAIDHLKHLTRVEALRWLDVHGA